MTAAANLVDIANQEAASRTKAAVERETADLEERFDAAAAAGVNPVLPVALAVLAFPSLSSGPFITSVGVVVMSYAVLATSWNFVGGFTGYISLGHAAYSGLGGYATALLIIEAGQRLSLQKHAVKDESILVREGRMRLYLEGDDGEIRVEELGPGAHRRVATGRVHRYEAIERCEIVEVSTPELDDVIRLEDDYGREGTSEA